MLRACVQVLLLYARILSPPHTTTTGTTSTTTVTPHTTAVQPLPSYSLAPRPGHVISAGQIAQRASVWSYSTIPAPSPTRLHPATRRHAPHSACLQLQLGFVGNLECAEVRNNGRATCCSSLTERRLSMKLGSDHFSYRAEPGQPDAPS